MQPVMLLECPFTHVLIHAMFCRAVMRSQPLLESIKYVTGSTKDDEQTFKLMNRLVSSHPKKIRLLNMEH